MIGRTLRQAAGNIQRFREDGRTASWRPPALEPGGGPMGSTMRSHEMFVRIGQQAGFDESEDETCSG